MYCICVACLHAIRRLVCLRGVYSECSVRVSGGVWSMQVLSGGGFGYLDKGLCLYLYAIPKK